MARRRIAVGVRLAVLAGGLATACGGGPDPTAAIEAADRQFRIAEQSKAEEYAPGEMTRARAEIEEARRLAGKKGTWDDARREAEKAAIDAELAEQRSRTERKRLLLEEARAALEALQGEAGRSR